MPIPKILLSYLLTAVVFFAIDLLWLGLVAKGFYAKEMGGMMAEKVKWQAAIVFYCIYIVGILVFVVFPAAEKESLIHALGLGALFGLVCYSTFDLTCYALLKGFPFKVVWVDMIWGTVLTGSVSTAGYFIVKWLK